MAHLKTKTQIIMKTLRSILVLAALIIAILAVLANPTKVGANTFDNAVIVTNNADVLGLTRKIDLGAPALSSTNALVTGTALKVGAFVITGGTYAVPTANGGTTVNTGKLDVPRNVSVLVVTTGTAADTLGKMTITGVDMRSKPATETLTLATGVNAGKKVFKRVTGITVAGWVAADGADLVFVGSGNLIGLPVKLNSATGLALATLGTTVGVYPTTGGDIQTSTINASAATYDGSKVLTVYTDR